MNTFKFKLWILQHSSICRKIWRNRVAKLNRKLAKENAGYRYVPYIIDLENKNVIYSHD